MAVNNLIATGHRLGNPAVTADEFILDGIRITSISTDNTPAEDALVTAEGVDAVIASEMSDFTGDIATLEAEIAMLGDNTYSPDEVRTLTNEAVGDVAVKTDKDYYIGNDRLTYLMSPKHYERSNMFSAKDTNTVNGRRTLVVPDTFSVAIDSSKKLFFWYDRFMELPMLTLLPGKDYCIYVCDKQDGTSLPVIIVSINKTVPTGYTTENSRKIGGFHTLCEDIDHYVAKEHPLYGYKAGDVLPNSIWDLNFCPDGCSPDGMVYNQELDIWIDIYYTSEIDSTSTYADGPSVSITPADGLRLISDMDKRLLTTSEFQIAMQGSPEEQGLNKYCGELDINLDLNNNDGLILFKNLTSMIGLIAMDTINGIDSSNGLSNVLYTSSTAIIDTKSIITEYTHDGFRMGNDALVGNYEHILMYQIFHCTEELVAEDGTIWKYNPLTGFGFCKYTGDGMAGRTISNPTGKVPGMMLFKSTNVEADWRCHLKAQNDPSVCGTINASDVFDTEAIAILNDVAPTTEVITLGPDTSVNGRDMDFTKRAAANGYADAFYGIGSNDSVIVVVGTAGEIQTSPDGIIWTKQTQADNYAGHFQSIIWNGSIFIAVGNLGGIQTSPDGVTWTTRTPGGGFTTGNIGGVTSSDSVIVFVGADGEIQTSPDGITWTHRDNANGYVGFFHSVTWNGSIFIVVGESGEIQTSPDGITWTKRIPASGFTGILLNVIWNGSIFVATGNSGEIQTSPDGVVWTKRIPDGGYNGYLWGASWNGSILMVTGQSGEIQTSPDGITWTHRDNANGYSAFFRSATYHNDLFIVVGDTGEIQTGVMGTPGEYMLCSWFGEEKALTGEYSIAWDKQDTDGNISTALRTIGNNGSIVIAAGDIGEIQTSPDGITWTHRVPANGYNQYFRGIIWNGTIFVLVGHIGEIQTSPDGITWTKRTQANSYNGNFRDVTWNGSIFVIIGMIGEIQTSPDGITWTHRDNANGFNEYLYGVAWNGTVFVIVGVSGEIQTSPDGITWTKRTQANAYNGTFLDIIWNGSLFITVGTDGEIQTSPDGITWTHRANANGSSNFFWDITWGNNILTAIGDNGEIQTSPDGVTWTKQLGMPDSTNLYGGDYFNDKFLIGGDIGVILTGIPNIIHGTDYSSFQDITHIDTTPTKVELGIEPDIILFKSTDVVGSWYWFSRVRGWNYITLNGMGFEKSINALTYGGIKVEGSVLTISEDFPSANMAIMAFKDHPTGLKTIVTYGNKPQDQVYPTKRIINGMDFTGEDTEGLVWSKSRTLADWMRVTLSNNSEQLTLSLQPEERTPEPLPQGVHSFNKDGISLSNNPAYAVGQTSAHHVWKTDEKVILDGVEWNVNRATGFAWSINDGSLPSWENIDLPALTNLPTHLTWTGSEFLLTDVGGIVHTSLDGIDWTVLYTDITAIFYKCIYANGKYILATNTGIRYSVDGITWQQSTLDGYGGIISDILWDGARYIACGNNREIQTSPDGITWTHRVIDPTNGYLGHWTGMAWNGSIALIIGASAGELQSSPDGTAWTCRTPVGGYVNGWNAIATKDNRFVIAGVDGEIQTSLDGITWEVCVKPAGYTTTVWQAISANDEGWLLTSNDGNQLRSTDGITWYNCAIPENTLNRTMLSVVGIGTYFLTVDDQTNTWISSHVKSLPLPITTKPKTIIRHGLETGYIVGASWKINYCNGMLFRTTQHGIYSSPDGLSWTWVPVPEAEFVWLNNVVYVNSMYVMVGYDGVIITSPDGINWTKRVSGTNSHFYDLIWNGTIFLAVGFDATIRTSPDGITWTQRTPDVAYNGGFRDSTWNGSIFMIVGDAGEVQTSPDGITWTHRDSLTTVGQLTYVLWTGTLFVVAGSDGFIQTSPDGINWTQRTPANGFASYFYGIAYNGSILVMVGYDAEIQTSPDGITWTKQTAPNGYTNICYDVTWTGDQFVIVGYDGAIFTSPDGFTWSEIPLTNEPWYTWRDGITTGNITTLNEGKVPEPSKLLGSMEPTPGRLLIDSRFNLEGESYLNQVWFEPEDLSSFYYGTFTHTNGVDSVIDTGVLNPTFVMYGEVNGPGNWMRFSPDWDAWYSISSDAIPADYPPFTIVDGILTWPSITVTGNRYVMVVGEDEADNFKTIITEGDVESFSTGGNSSTRLSRIVSDDGVEDGTGCKWQTLGTCGGYNIKDTGGMWSDDNAKGKRFDHGQGVSLVMVGGGPVGGSSSANKSGTECFSMNYRNTGYDSVTLRGCAKSKGRCPYK